MVRIIVALLFVFGAVTATADDSRKGYVLKSGEGEVVWGSTIKASSEMGTRDIEVIVWPAPEGFSTGLHYHIEADEYFYVLSGSGTAIIGENEYMIESGDFMFVPAGVDHKIVVKEPIEMFEFLDRPNQVGELRAWHKAYGDAMPESLEQLNEIAERFGTVYKTLE